MRFVAVLAGTIFSLVLAACSAVSTISAPDGMVVCQSPRPEVCTLEYDPACGILENRERKEYPNGCAACADPAVTGYIPGACAESLR